MSHTLGPWTLPDCPVRGDKIPILSGPLIIAHALSVELQAVFFEEPILHDKSAQANARLIAAAPELLLVATRALAILRLPFVQRRDECDLRNDLADLVARLEGP